MKPHYDFFAIGQKYSLESAASISKRAHVFEKEYGAKARIDFVLGWASMVPQYFDSLINGDDIIQFKSNESLDEFSIKGTTDFSVEEEPSQDELGMQYTLEYRPMRNDSDNLL